MHGSAFAIDSRMRARAVQEKSERGLGVAMNGRNLARHDKLEARIKRGGHPVLAGKPRFLRMRTRRSASLAVKEVLLGLGIAPEMRDSDAFGLGGDEAREDGPEGRIGLRADFVIEGQAFRRVCRP